ncbi:hypothetical protein JP0545_06370 [Helicobacter pylori]
MTKPILSILAPFFIATLLYFLGTPDGLNPNAWLYFCIFIGMIIRHDYRAGFRAGATRFSGIECVSAVYSVKNWGERWSIEC